MIMKNLPCYICSCVFLLAGCSTQIEKMKSTRSACYKNAVSSIDRLLTLEERKKLLTSDNVVISKKFGAIKIKIIKAFSLDNPDTCIPKYFFSNYAISDVIEISGRLIERYKLENNN